jgi:hypothetical protein
LAERRDRRKIICGGCGERVRADTAQDAYRTVEDGFTRFRNHPVAGSTLTSLCPTCYREWDVATDGLPSRL